MVAWAVARDVARDEAWAMARGGGPRSDGAVAQMVAHALAQDMVRW